MNFDTFYSDLNWNRFIFDDECSFSSEKDGIKFVRRPAGHRFDPEYANSTSHSERKMVSIWSATAKDGFGPMVRLDSALNKYVEILDTYGKEFIQAKFCSDESIESYTWRICANLVRIVFANLF